MKRARKHRKRHLLPGPAGLRQQQHQQRNSQPNNANNSNNANEDQDDSYGRDGGNQNQLKVDHDDHDQKQEEGDPEMIHEHVQIWDAMCLSLHRILPSISVSMSMNHNNNSNKNSKRRRRDSNNSNHMSQSSSWMWMRQALHPNYTLLSELPHHLQSSFFVPKVVVQIHTIQSHGHDNFTVYLSDESTSTSAHASNRGKKNGGNTSTSQMIHQSTNPMVIGWLSQSLIRNHPEWIQPGTVFLLSNVSIAIFRKGSGSNTGTIMNSDSGGIYAYDRMMVVGEENIVYAWTKEHGKMVNNEDYLRLLEWRSDVEDKFTSHLRVGDGDEDGEDEDECEGEGEGGEETEEEDLDVDQDTQQDEIDNDNENENDVPIGMQNPQTRRSQPQTQTLPHSQQQTISITAQQTQNNNYQKNNDQNDNVDDDWSNVPQSSTMPVNDHAQAHHIYNQKYGHSHGQNAHANANTRTNVNANTVVVQQGRVQVPISGSGSGSGSGSINSENRSTSQRSNANDMSASTNSRQTTIVTGPNQRLVTSNSKSTSVSGSGSRSNSSPALSGAAVRSANGIINPYAKKRNTSATTSTSITTPLNATAPTASTVRLDSNFSVDTVNTTASNYVRPRNPYLKKNLQAQAARSVSSSASTSTVSSVTKSPSVSTVGEVTAGSRVASQGIERNTGTRSITHSDNDNINVGIERDAPTPVQRAVTQMSSLTHGTPHYTSQSSSIWNDMDMNMNAFDEEEPSQDALGGRLDVDVDVDATVQYPVSSSVPNANDVCTVNATTTTGMSCNTNNTNSQVQDVPVPAPPLSAPAPPLSASIFSNLNHLEDDEMDAFLEDDDEC